MLDRLNKEMLFFDGAMGTQLQELGMSTGGIPEEWNIDKAELLTQVHERYLRAGADFITTNTFGCNALKMKRAKYSVAEMIDAAVANARKAQENCGRTDDSYVVLDIGPIGTMLKPIGTLSFDEAYEIYKEQVLCAAGKVDAVLLETMTDLYEVKAAILAVKENSSLPVFVTMTFESSGRNLTGTDVETFVNVIEGLGVDALGVNCSLGPAELGPIIEDLLHFAHIPVMAQPNAGLPEYNNGKTVYNMTPEVFCDSMLPFAQNGLAIIGGCCGTSPEYIHLLKEKMPSKVNPRSNPYETKVSSSLKTVTFRGQIVICGERLNPTGKKKMQQALINEDYDELVLEGLRQVQAGADILDVNVGHPSIDEEETMKKLIPILQDTIDLPLQIDSSSVEALETACRYYNGKPLINSVSGKEASLSEVLPIVKKYGAVVIGLALGETLPLKAEERIDVAKKIISRAAEYGIPKEDIIVDCLCLTASAQQQEVVETLKAIREIREMGHQTVLGVSNVSFGLPNRSLINRTFLTMALQAGLTYPIINPMDAEMMGCIDAYKVLMNEDPGSVEYVEKHSEDLVVKTEKKKKTKQTCEKMDLFNMICHGMRENVAEQTKLELEKSEPMTVINEVIIPALNKVGLDYEKGIIFLPQLIQSAEATKLAFEEIKKCFQSDQPKKGPVLICTVEGDIHDIGKNIVKVVLESYGYDMIDLGKDVKVEKVVEAYKTYQPKAIGLSALMTTTVTNMKRTIAALHEAGCTVPIWVGGAVLTQHIADEIGADYYAKDAMASVHQMGRIMSEVGV